MNFVALRMLTGDRAKYFGLVFAIAFCTFLLENQTSIFANIMRGARSRERSTASSPCRFSSASMTPRSPARRARCSSARGSACESRTP